MARLPAVESTTSRSPDSSPLVEDQILNILEASATPLRASEISVRLGRLGVKATKTQVNSCLYGVLAGRVVQNRNYAWEPIGRDTGQEASASQAGQENLRGSWGRFQRVISYYIDCVREDEGSEIRTFLTDEGEKFIPFDHPEEWVGSELNSFSVEVAEISRFVKLLRQSKNRGAMVYGYPLYVDWIERSRRGWTGGFAIPVFLQSLEYTFSADSIVFSLQNQWPRVNPAFLEKLFRTSSERNEYLEEMGLLMPEGPPPEGGLSEVVLRMQSVTPEMDGIGDLDPDDLDNEREISNITRGGLHNRGIIAMTEPLKFTAGLERELQLLGSRVKEPALEKTSLRVFFGDGSTTADVEQVPVALSEVVPVNDEQRAAVSSAFRNPITVVTGPPGTGKSQVVTNILANAYMNGQSVLFTSRNNKGRRKGRGTGPES